jgi:hypothetical protein
MKFEREFDISQIQLQLPHLSVPLVQSYTYVIDIEVHTEITTSRVMRAMNLQSPERQPGRIRYDFSAEVETAVPPKT